MINDEPQSYTLYQSNQKNNIETQMVYFQY